jgi:single-strand DNA-binding protein
MNKVLLYGNIGKDPEVKRLESGKIVAKFSLATNKNWTNPQGEKIKETSWHNIILWGKLAELAEKYVKKGDSLIIEGEISYRSYENKEGQTVYITEIIGNGMHFVSKKEDPKPASEPEKEWKGKQPVQSMSDISELERLSNIPPDDEIPF